MTKVKRIINDEQFAPFFEGVDEFCDFSISATPAHGEIGAPKIFADPVEGYATLAGWEVAILNTGLLQRLRFISQLGLAYLVYPTLGYSRFEHTLGVVARLEQVILHLKENIKIRGALESKMIRHLPEERQLTAARLAALCHDMGHCIYSHVSESVIETLPDARPYPSVGEVLKSFAELAGRRIPIAEIFSASMLTSRPFVNFLRTIGVPDCSTFSKANDLAINAAHIMLGLPIPGDPSSLFLGQLMSSGLDIDKLDYMLRESHLSGISLGISLDWLLRKLMLFEVKGTEIPEEIKPRVEKSFGQDDRFAILGLEKGGQFAFEEFCVARLTLHDKIYMHQKIRAAEAYVRERLSELARTVPEYAEAHRWLYLTQSLFEYPTAELPALPAIESSLLRGTAPRTVGESHLRKIVTRDLLYRAYAFGWQNAIAEPLHEGRVKGESGTDKLMALVKENPQEFKAMVQERLQEIRRILESEVELPAGNPGLIIDLPRISSIQQGHDTLFIDRPRQLALRWTIPIDRIVEYYHDNRALGYIFAEKAHLPLISLAAEKAVWDRFGVIYVQDGCLNNNVVKEAAELKARLHAKGYYRLARLLHPTPKRLYNFGPQNVIWRVAGQLGSYESRLKEKVTPVSIQRFVAQFPDDLQEAALAWIQHIQWIEPDIGLRGAFDAVMESQPFCDLKRIAFCPLGAMADSAYRFAYNLRNIAHNYSDTEKDFQLLALNEALARQFQGYVFYDDNTNSGKQALNILASWLGKELPTELQLAEEHVQELPQDLKEELLAKPIALTFAVATDGAKERLMKNIPEHTGVKSDHLVCEVAKILAEDSRIFSGPASPFQHTQKRELTKFLRDVAFEILTKVEYKSDDKAKRDALGYHSAEAMVIFPYNCPTMTVTALWIRGPWQSDEWVPLAERARRGPISRRS